MYKNNIYFTSKYPIKVYIVIIYKIVDYCRIYKCKYKDIYI